MRQKSKPIISAEREKKVIKTVHVTLIYDDSSNFSEHKGSNNWEDTIIPIPFTFAGFSNCNQIGKKVNFHDSAQDTEIEYLDWLLKKIIFSFLTVMLTSIY